MDEVFIAQDYEERHAIEGPNAENGSVQRIPYLVPVSSCTWFFGATHTPCSHQDLSVLDRERIIRAAFEGTSVLDP